MAANPSVMHLLSGLQIGGKERAALRLALRGRAEGADHRLVLFDTPFRSENLDFAPGTVPTQFIPRKTGLDVRFVRKLARLLRSQRPDVLHGHSTSAIFYGALACAMVRHPPRLIGTHHARPTAMSWRGRWLARWASERTAATTAVSADLANWLVRHQWAPRVLTLVNGVEIEKFRPQSKTGYWHHQLSLPTGTILIGHIGRFDRIKRQIDLVEAARRLGEQQNNFAFLFIGDGPLRESIQLAALPLPNVHFVQSVHPICPLLNELDLLVMCSEHEATPLVLLEALSSGCPVLATAVGGIPALFCSIGLGTTHLVPPFQPALLAEAIFRLTNTVGLKERFVELAYTRMPELSFDHEWVSYRRLYEAK